MSSIKSLVGIQLQQNYQMLVILGLLRTDTWYVANPSVCDVTFFSLLSPCRTSEALGSMVRPVLVFFGPFSEILKGVPAFSWFFPKEKLTTMIPVLNLLHLIQSSLMSLSLKKEHKFLWTISKEKICSHVWLNNKNEIMFWILITFI